MGAVNQKIGHRVFRADDYRAGGEIGDPECSGFACSPGVRAWPWGASADTEYTTGEGHQPG